MLGMNKLRSWIFKKKYHLKGKVRLLGKLTIRGNPRISVGNEVTFYPGTIIWGDGDFIIGDNVIVGDNNFFLTSKEGGITIGNDVMIAARCYIIDKNHSHDISKGIYYKQGFEFSKISIGNNCWIGTGVTILPGANLGNNNVVAANAVVNHSFTSNLIIGGVPAKAIRKYDFEKNKWVKVEDKTISR